MSKIKSNLILSGEFQTLTRDELKSVVGGGWCWSQSDCHWKTTSCGGGEEQTRFGHCQKGNHWWSWIGTCTYAACPEIGEVQSLEMA